MSSLNLKAVGDFSLILQKFKHKQHKLFCVIKVFRRLNMYNWLSYIDMMQIEAELMRVCEDIDWKDLESIANFSTELHIESNIKLRIKAVNGLASSVMTLMGDTIKPTRDIVLQIDVKHLPMDDKGAAKPQAVELQNSIEPNVAKIKQRIFCDNNNTELKPKLSAATSSRPVRSHAIPMRYKDFILEDDKRRCKENRDCDERKLYPMPAADGDDSLPNDEESSLGTYALTAVRVKPPEVEILTLPLTEEEVLSSFEKYRIHFDKYFQETKHRTRGAFSYEGIGFIDVADLISLDTRRNMGVKLRKNYVKDGFTPHVPICIDGLLPLWTVRLFMDYHKLEHDAAVEHIKAQNMLNRYETVHGDKPLASDIEDW